MNEPKNDEDRASEKARRAKLRRITERAEQRSEKDDEPCSFRISCFTRYCTMSLTNITKHLPNGLP